MGKTKIEWTSTRLEDGRVSRGYSFNPWWGCTKVSDGCKFCYANSIASRYGHDVWGPGKPRRTFGEKHWGEPLKWNTEAQRQGVHHRVFCASMADVFDEEAPAGERERLWQLIRETPHLDWQLLTKRPHLIAELLPSDWNEGWLNVWLGTSIEDERVLHRVGELTKVPARVHFLSVEPLIGPIEMLPLHDVEWVIVGGESGPKSRNIESEWVESIQSQCQAARVPFFFKQWGGVRKHLNGRELNGREWNEMPLPIMRRTQLAAA